MIRVNEEHWVLYICDINIALLTNFLLTQVLRDGQWQERDAAILVPGDIISIKLGDIIPADARLLEGDPLKIDQANSLKTHQFV